MTHALSFVSMGVEARCCPSKSTAHCRHMKRQPFLCNGCRCRGHPHCHHHRHLRCCCRLNHHRCCRCPLPSPLAIAVAVAVDLCHRHLCCIAISHHRRCCRCPRHQPLLSPSLLAIAVAISVGHHCHCPVGHFRELLPWHSKNCIQPIEAKNAHLILFCSDSGRRTDQSRMTDQVLCSNGQLQHWAARGKQ
jgi:hypothetical protein